MEFRRDVLLSDWTWWKIGGPADHFCLPKSVDEVRSALDFAKREGLAITVLGGGTNVLVSDSGLRGLVLCTRELRGLEIEEIGGTNEGLDGSPTRRLVITALAGTPKAELVKQFLRRRLPPALFLCGLPGDVGGGVVMNAGVGEKSRPREFVEIVDWVEVLNFAGELRRYERDELKWSYRSTKGWEPGIVVRAAVSWDLGDVDPDLGTRVKEATKRRLAKQPLELPSCGSTFLNPAGAFAGQLIETAGLKGYRVGGAEVSEKHANFIVNRGGATAADVWAVIAHVRAEVERASGVKLGTEVKFLGEF